LILKKFRLFAYLFRDNVVKAVTFLLLAVTLSEAFALLLLIVLYRRADKTDGALDGQAPKMRSILSLSVPVTFSASLFPLSSLIDSVLAVRLLGKYAENAVTLYGLFSGGAVTVVGYVTGVRYLLASEEVAP
jgi:O-antigen/teichoic acid export membrane protein